MPFSWDQITQRPFYTKYAWAYDELVNKPVKENSQNIAEYLQKQFGTNKLNVLDAGCGNGGYSFNLGKAGFNVMGIDLSNEQIEQAKKNNDLDCVSFEKGNFLEVNAVGRFDVVLCRGVLNDITDLKLRSEVFSHFHSLLKPEGILIADVRNWENSRDAIIANPIVERTVVIPRGRLEFSSLRRINENDQSYDLNETHRLYTDDDGVHSESFNFKMICSTEEQLKAELKETGFQKSSFFGNYDFKSGSKESVYIVSISQK